MRKKLSLLLACSFIIVSLSACGKKNDVDDLPTVNDKTEQVTTESNGNNPGNNATTSDATRGDATVKTAHNIVGYYEGSNTYVNELAGFKLVVDEVNWNFLSAEEVAKSMGLEEKDIKDLWEGKKSLYDQKDSNMAVCAIAANKKNGSNIIVDYYYVSTDINKETTSQYYLSVAAKRHENAEFKTVKFVDKDFDALIIPPEEGSTVTQVMYATKVNDLIVIISFSLNEGDKIENIESMFKPLQN